MELSELTSWLDANDGWGYKMDDKGVLIRNEAFRTVTHCTLEAVTANGLETITAACSHGRDVDHITRVTGYFSKTSGWNKGKTAELRDRHRSRM